MKKKRFLFYGVVIIFLLSTIISVGLYYQKTDTSDSPDSSGTYSGGIDWNGMKGGVVFTYSDDFDVTSLNVSLDKLNQLSVYKLKGPEDAQKYYERIGNVLWGDESKNAKFEDKTYKDDSGKTQHEYFLKLQRADGYKGIFGYTSSFTMNDEMLPDIKNVEKLKESEKEKLVESYCKKIRLGVWDSQTCLGTVVKDTKWEYRLQINLDGIEASEANYQTSWDDKAYGSCPPISFTFNRQDVLQSLSNGCRYDITGKRTIAKKYDNDSLKKCVEDIEKAVKRHDTDTALREEFEITDAAVRYGFYRVPRSMDELCGAVPILELRGNVKLYFLTSRNLDTYKCSLAVNLDTGEVMCYDNW